MVDVNLNVIRYSVWTSVEIMGQALITELHQQNEVARVGILVRAEVLHYVRVLYGAEKAAFLVELFQRNILGSGIVHEEEGRVHDLGSAQELVASGLAHGPV